MAKYAVIVNNKVVNAVEADEDFAKTQGWVLLVGNAGIGWEWDGSTFVEPPIEEKISTTE